MRAMDFKEYYGFLTEPVEIFSNKSRLDMLGKLDKINVRLSLSGIKLGEDDHYRIKACILYELEHCRDLTDPDEPLQIENIDNVVYIETSHPSNMRIVKLSTGKCIGIRCYPCQPARKADVVIFKIHRSSLFGS